MCNLVLEGTRAILDMAKCPYEFASPEFLNLHLKDLSTIEKPIKTIRYEEEIVIELTEQQTTILTEYSGIIRQIESLLMKEEIYGNKQDPQFDNRRKKLRKFYEYAFMNPVMAGRELDEYKEEAPEKQVFMKGYQTFKAWVNGILKRFTETKMYALTKKTGDMRLAFLSVVGLKSMYFVSSIILDIPAEAKPIKSANAAYSLSYGIEVQIYEVPGADAYLYVQRNKEIEELAMI